jgi:hypothetical protein
MSDQWRDIKTAPKHEPILGWCVHRADPYHEETTGRLTDYGCHAEALSRVQDGANILVWGGGDTDYDEWSGKTISWPEWWFRLGSDFQEVANPTHWMPLPNPPQAEERDSAA